MNKQADDAAYEAWKADPTDEKMVVLALAIRRHARAVVGMILHRNEPDLIGDIVTKALLKEPTFRGDALFSTWLHKLATSSCYDHIRRSKVRRERSLEGLSQHDFLQLASPPLAGQVHAQVMLDALRGELSNADFELLEAVMAGETLGEVAEKWLQKRSKVRAMWYRLKRKLQKRLMASTSPKLRANSSK